MVQDLTPKPKTCSNPASQGRSGVQRLWQFSQSRRI